MTVTIHPSRIEARKLKRSYTDMQSPEFWRSVWGVR